MLLVTSASATAASLFALDSLLERQSSLMGGRIILVLLHPFDPLDFDSC